MAGTLAQARARSRPRGGDVADAESYKIGELAAV
jgi:hypothetical protein